jgi:hypothetical protein
MKLVRLAIYVGGIAPLLILMSITLGSASLTFLLFVVLLLSLALLHLRYLVAVNQNDMRNLVVGECTKLSPLAIILKANPTIFLGGYSVYKVFPPDDDNPYTGDNPFILITDRTYIKPYDRIVAYRIQDDIYLEA